MRIGRRKEDDRSEEGKRKIDGKVRKGKNRRIDEGEEEEKKIII